MRPRDLPPIKPSETFYDVCRALDVVDSSGNRIARLSRKEDCETVEFEIDGKTYGLWLQRLNIEPSRNHLSPKERLAIAEWGWGLLIERLEESRRFSLVGVFQHARIERWEPDGIDLTFPSERVDHSWCTWARDESGALREFMKSIGWASPPITTRCDHAESTGVPF